MSLYHVGPAPEGGMPRRRRPLVAAGSADAVHARQA